MGVIVGATGFLLVDGDGAGRAPARARHWLVCAVLIIVAQWLSQFVFAAVYSVSNLASGDDGILGAFGYGHGALFFVMRLLPFYAVLALVTLIASARVDGRNAAALGLSWKALVEAWPWLFVGLITAIAPLWFVLSLPSGWSAEVLGAAPTLLAGALLTGIGEEVFFRGVIMTCLIARYGAFNGVPISALLFAVWHISVGLSAADVFLYLTTTFIFGLTAAIVALHQGHLGGAIALHVVWNFTADVEVGLRDFPAGFWSSHANYAYQTNTFAEIFQLASVNSLLLPLMIETTLVLWLCRKTVLRIIASRPQPTAQAPGP